MLGLHTITSFVSDDAKVELINRSYFMSGEIIEDTCRVIYDDRTEIYSCIDWENAKPQLITMC